MCGITRAGCPRSSPFPLRGNFFACRFAAIVGCVDVGCVLRRCWVYLRISCCYVFIVVLLFFPRQRVMAA
ncbi:MAG: hypothetical protein LBQ66_02020 [Planctomycetaceae bacterium]|nr:hypothetical protein [Planctomycetaceae bacterium]